MKLPLTLQTRGRTLDALAIGENSVDLLAVVNGQPTPDSKAPLVSYAELPGGEAASAAVGLARLGWRAGYVGRFGDDRLGDLCRQRVAAEGVDLSEALIVENTTNRLAIILVDRATGSRTVLWQRDPRLALLPGDVRDETLAAATVLLVGSDDADTMADIASRARTAGVRVVGDLEHVRSGTPALLQELDVAVMAAGFPKALTGDGNLTSALHRVASMTPAPLVCVTLGDQGCLAVIEGREVRVPAFGVPVADTTGAGDLFRAGLIAHWLAHPEGPEIEELLRYANAVAALNCRQVGAQAAAPTAAEVDALLGS